MVSSHDIWIDSADPINLRGIRNDDEDETVWRDDSTEDDGEVVTLEDATLDFDPPNENDSGYVGHGA